MKKFTILTVAVIVASSSYVYNSFADRDATPEERAKVVEALTAVGCSTVGEIELDGKYFEAEDVVCEDGEKYEVHLDQEFNITKKKLDD
jgi:hypothetical protein